MPEKELTDQAGGDDGFEAFALSRARLFGIAYRMLGSASEAEDVVQDTWIRWQGCDRTKVRYPPAFLATTTTRLALNALQTARVRRETYIGPWLPEPVDTTNDPGLGAERGEALALAVLFLMEKLSPAERAAYVLREAFEYPYSEIAGVLDFSESNVRQLVSRARKHLSSERSRPVSAGEQKRLFTAFIEAARNGDVEGLKELLAEDVVSYSDGNGAVRVARFPIIGIDRVTKFLVAIRSFWIGAPTQILELNGQLCIFVLPPHGLPALVTVDCSSEGITRVMWQRNPAKLAHLAGTVHQIS